MWEEALERAERAGDERVAAGILRSLAIAAGSRGRQDRAGELLDRAIVLARRTGDDQQLRLLLGSAAEMQLWLGKYQVAEDSYGDAIDLASSIGDLSARPLLLAELGWVALLRGDVVRAERLSVEATAGERTSATAGSGPRPFG
jgi:tetratricopeptide (TPR) repeat protein